MYKLIEYSKFLYKTYFDAYATHYIVFMSLFNHIKYNANISFFSDIRNGKANITQSAWIKAW